MTLYATGARNSELTSLKVSDIDSQRMVVHIRGGKGRKDRDVMLSAKLLAALRAHWRYYHRQSSSWLFPSNVRKDRPIDTKTVWYACQNSRQRAGLRNASTRTPCDTASRPTSRGWRRPPHHSTPARPSRPEGDLSLPTCVARASARPPVHWMRCRYSLPQRARPALNRCVGHLWRWPM